MSFSRPAILSSVFLSWFLIACSESVPLSEEADSLGFSAPSLSTQRLHRAQDGASADQFTTQLALASRGLLARPDAAAIRDGNAEIVWDLAAYDFMSGYDAPPASVHPALWRQASLNNVQGLFEVRQGIYQVRGFDLSNMSLIEGEQGWIIVDPLTAAETADHAFQFAMKHLGRKPVTAILFTHSHIDHFGGIEGILKHLDTDERDALRVIAPEGFMAEATSENLIAGPAMSRRAMYMYGKRLPRSARGHVGSGLGKGPAFGRFGILTPTELIYSTDQALVIDGVEFEFQIVSGSEAPAEFTFYLPELKTFCAAELVTRTMHNLYTLRGAKVRDALVWSGFIDAARKRFADAEVLFASHHWPVWGRDEIQAYLGRQRDLYRYIHDQSVRLMNAGMTPNEIADQIRLPQALRQDMANMGFYGSLKHNARAVYQSYMGWFTGNPAMLDPLPEEDSARRMIALMGGVDKVLIQAEQLYQDANEASPEDANREYRWLAQLLNQALFAAPDNARVRALLANTYDQLGYQARSAPWRDFYLSGAYELRHGGPDEGINPAIMKHILRQTPPDKLFDSMAANLNGPDAEDVSLTMGIRFSDLDAAYLLTLENSVLRHESVAAIDVADVDALLSLPHHLFIDILVGDAGLKETVFSDALAIEGSKWAVISLLSRIDRQSGTFNIVEP